MRGYAYFYVIQLLFQEFLWLEEYSDIQNNVSPILPGAVSFSDYSGVWTSANPQGQVNKGLTNDAGKMANKAVSQTFSCF